jgi:hypothetical protein
MTGRWRRGSRGHVRAAWRARAAVLALAAIAWPMAAAASTRYDPRLRFRTIATARFDIHFHQGEDALARRLARIAEETATELDASLGPARGRVQVILVDQTDLANGWASPVPYNTIEITAAAPTGESAIGNTDDWLRLVFTHEYTHVVHLSRAGGWIGGLQRVFGRLPVLYPNLFQPLWQIEGIATWQESTSTGAGRLHAGDFRQLMERGAAAGRFEPLDRASVWLVDWPSGNTPYLYGGFFHDYLARKYGAESLRRLTDDTARRLPYTGSLAYRKVFGRSLGSLWDDFEAEVARAGPPVPSEASRLTRHGFFVSGPRFAGGGRLLYSVANPHGFPSLMEIPAAGGEPRVVTTRYLGSGIGVAGARLVFDQIEIVRHVGRQSDLYVLDRDSGGQWRLTREARAADPDVSPDGRTIVCTVVRADRRELATLAMPGGRGASGPIAPLVSDAETYFAAPRWSPDGRWIAAERRARGGPSEIVLVNPAAKTTDVLARVSRGRAITPAWASDGQRVLFAAARDGEPFRIHAVDISTREVVRLEATGPAHSPEPSPDGATLVYVGYTPDGHDLFALPLKAARWTPVRDDPAAAAPAPATTVEPQPTHGAPRTYSPWRTLAPRFWTPTVESDAGELVAGAATGSFDALGRHAYGVEAGWSASRARPDWQAAYAYDRWWPTMFVSASDDTDPWVDGEIRSREIDAGVLLPWRRVRWSQSALAAVNASTDAFGCARCDPPVDRAADRRSVRLGWNVTSARSFGYSISAEEGGSIAVTSELTRDALGADGNADAVTVEIRRYIRVRPRHAVIAARAAAAASWGDESVARLFSASGSGPQTGGFDFGSDAIGLLRGFHEGDVADRRAAVVNVDYRFPLVRLERGAGTIPFFVRALHGALFADAGHAWSERASLGDARLSLGAELSIDTVVGFVLPLTFSSGAAWRRDPVGDHDGWVAFGRIGRAF